MSAQLYTDAEFATGAHGGAEAIARLVALVVAHGGLCRAWGDATTYHTDGTLPTAANLDHANAHVTWQYPNGQQHCAQRLADNQTWRVVRSRTGGALGGAPTATQAPTLANGKVVAGAGTEAAPVGAVIFDVAGWTGNLGLVVDGTLMVWFLFGYDAGAPGNVSAACCLDSLLEGSYPAGDVDPFSDYWDLAANSPNGWAISDTQNFSAGNQRAFIAAGLGGEVFDRLGDMLLRGSAGLQPVPGGLQQNPHNAKDDLIGVDQLVRKSTGEIYYKGQSYLRRFVGQAHSTGHLFQVAAAGDRIQVGSYALPWNNHALAGGPGTTSSAVDWAAPPATPTPAPAPPPIPLGPNTGAGGLGFRLD